MFRGSDGLEDYEERLCSLVGLVWNAIDPKGVLPSDGFCRKCPCGHTGNSNNFQNTGEPLEWIRQAIVEKLQQGGIPIPDGWDEEGKEIP